MVRFITDTCAEAICNNIMPPLLIIVIIVRVDSGRSIK